MKFREKLSEESASLYLYFVSAGVHVQDLGLKHMKWPISLYTCAPFSGLPSNIKNKTETNYNLGKHPVFYKKSSTDNIITIILTGESTKIKLKIPCI